MIPIIITSIILFAGLLFSVIGLFIAQKEEQKFERKGVFYYALISFLLFFLLGLLGLLNEEGPRRVLLISQATAGLFGIFHAWFLFANYDWADHASFLPETLLTAAITFAAGLGFLSGLWVWAYVFEFYDYSLAQYKAALWLPVPYLILRTYDFMLQIPQRKFIAWPYPETPAPRINLDSDNVRYIYLDFFTRSERYPAGRVAGLRSRIPLDATFSAFFQNFVQDYNEKNVDYPIVNLRTDEDGNPIGWAFYASRTKRGRKWALDPNGHSGQQVQEGDFVQARRLPLGEAFRSQPAEQPRKTGNKRQGPEDSGDEIIIIEKK
ncbi:MAG: hypothetical protein H6559_15945 [Lewinellaceae bacterium]|nr:hypothetical protein [Lewinellaceae bacterium]